MARLEDVLPALREGKRIKRPDMANELYIQLSLLANDWEIVPEPTRVADYLVPHSSTKCRPYVVTLFGDPNGDPILDELFFKQTHPIGSQPEGSVLIPNSERNQE